jgi:hypothetical protein
MCPEVVLGHVVRRMSSIWMPGRGRLRCVAVLAGCALSASSLAGAVPASARPLGHLAASSAAPSGRSLGAEPASASASLQQCLAVGGQAERSATFAGEMTAIPGTARMEMRINLIETPPGESQYHLVSSPGLGTWRISAPGVKLFTSINHVTNLSAPAFYKGAVRFRWLNAKGHVIKVQELRTPRCEQPAASSTSATTTSPAELTPTG